MQFYNVKFAFAAVILLFAFDPSAACSNPDVTSKYYTTKDATVVTNIAYVNEFSVKCKTGSLTNLYADINGNILPVSSIGADKYQVSWTEEIKSATSGEHKIPIFNEDGYNAIRKAMRAGEDYSSVAPLFTVSIHHPGAFTGPWFKSEFVAVAVAVIIAFSARSMKP